MSPNTQRRVHPLSPAVMALAFGNTGIHYYNRLPLLRIASHSLPESASYDPELEELTTVIVLNKKVPLFELAACAGDGFYSSGPSNVDHEIETSYVNADYAVRISGKSMEPTIEDQSIVFVQDVEELFDGDIGIFVVDNDVMCKRYRESKEGKWLEPDNKSPEYKSINFSNHTECRIQGKVLVK